MFRSAHRRSPSAGRLRQAFSWAPLVAVGAASYSIYLWQQMFLVPEWAGGWHLSTPVAVALALGAGFASRRFVEQPFLGGTHARRADAPV